MAINHAQPGEVVDVRPLGVNLADTKTKTLLKTEHVEVIRMVMPMGKELSQHKAPGEIIVQCVEGKIEFTAMGKAIELGPGQLFYLASEEPHSVRCIEEGSFLLTLLLKK